MIITNDTLLQSQAVVFMDGKEGWFRQTHKVYVNGEESKISFEVSGSRKEKVKRIFYFAGKNYDNMQDAFLAAGYCWARTI